MEITYFLEIPNLLLEDSIMRMRNKIKSCRKNNRRGAVAVEAAIAIPLVLFFTLGTLEITDGIYLRRKVAIAAYEGARVAISPGATEEAVQEAVAAYLDARFVEYSDISEIVTITPPLSGRETELDPVSVALQIDLASNSRLPLSIYRHVHGPKINAQTTMLVE